MKKEKILVPYKVILKRLWQFSYSGRIKVSKAREILTRNLRFGSHNWNELYLEMKSLGYITYCGRKGGIQLQIPLKDLI